MLFLSSRLFVHAHFVSIGNKIVLEKDFDFSNYYFVNSTKSSWVLWHRKEVYTEQNARISIPRSIKHLIFVNLFSFNAVIFFLRNPSDSVLGQSNLFIFFKRSSFSPLLFGEGVLLPITEVVKYSICEMTCRWVCDWLEKYCSVVLKFVIKIKGLLKLHRFNSAQCYSIFSLPTEWGNRESIYYIFKSYLITGQNGVL